MSRARTSQAGFTLVEVLVALFIFSILSAATLAVLTSTLTSKAQMAEKNTLLKQRASLRILLKSDFANTIAAPKADEYGQPEQAVFSGGNAGSNSLLRLARTGWDNPGGIERRSNLQAVDYALEKGVLIRRVRARYNAVSNTEIYEQPLLTGVDQAKLTFFDGEQWLENWVTGAPPLGVEVLPKLASLELIFENGETLRQIFYVGADQ